MSDTNFIFQEFWEKEIAVKLIEEVMENRYII